MATSTISRLPSKPPNVAVLPTIANEVNSTLCTLARVTWLTYCNCPRTEASTACRCTMKPKRSSQPPTAVNAVWRINIAARANGVARAAFDAAVGYINERVQSGRRIIEFQGMEFLLADMAAAVESARATYLEAARRRLGTLLAQAAPPALPLVRGVRGFVEHCIDAGLFQSGGVRFGIAAETTSAHTVGAEFAATVADEDEFHLLFESGYVGDIRYRDAPAAEHTDVRELIEIL